MRDLWEREPPGVGCIPPCWQEHDRQYLPCCAQCASQSVSQGHLNVMGCFWGVCVADALPAVPVCVPAGAEQLVPLIRAEVGWHAGAHIQGRGKELCLCSNHLSNGIDQCCWGGGVVALHPPSLPAVCCCFPPLQQECQLSLKGARLQALRNPRTGAASVIKSVPQVGQPLLRKAAQPVPIVVVHMGQHAIST